MNICGPAFAEQQNNANACVYLVDNYAGLSISDIRCFNDYNIFQAAVRNLNDHQLKAGGFKAFGGLHRRLKEKTAESRWFETTGQAPFGRAKAAYWKIKDSAKEIAFNVKLGRSIYRSL